MALTVIVYINRLSIRLIDSVTSNISLTKHIAYYLPGQTCNISRYDMQITENVHFAANRFGIARSTAPTLSYSSPTSFQHIASNP